MHQGGSCVYFTLHIYNNAPVFCTKRGVDLFIYKIKNDIILISMIRSKSTFY